MRRSRLLLPVASLGLLISALVLGLSSFHSHPQDAAGPAGKPDAGYVNRPLGQRRVTEKNPSGLNREEDYLQSLCVEFKKANSMEKRMGLYDALVRRILHTREPLAASKEIAAFIDSGQDASTGLPFEIGDNGFLLTAPTLRTALLDLQVELDAGIALELAQAIMKAPRNPDEHALAMRNLAWSPLLSKPERELQLTRGFINHLQQPEWLQQPSLGFLEAFDVAVSVPSFEVIEALAQVADGTKEGLPAPRKGVEFAATLAIAKAIQGAPEPVAEMLLENPALFQSKATARAKAFARLDIRNEQQLNDLTEYLNQNWHLAGELDSFADSYPWSDYLMGNFLVNPKEDIPSITEMQALDKADLAIISNSLEIGRLKKSATTDRILANLRERVEEAEAAATQTQISAPDLGSPEQMVVISPNFPSNGAAGRTRVVPGHRAYSHK